MPEYEECWSTLPKSDESFRTPAHDGCVAGTCTDIPPGTRSQVIYQKRIPQKHPPSCFEYGSGLGQRQDYQPSQPRTPNSFPTCTGRTTYDNGSILVNLQEASSTRRSVVQNGLHVRDAEGRDIQDLSVHDLLPHRLSIPRSHDHHHNGYFAGTKEQIGQVGPDCTAIHRYRSPGPTGNSMSPGGLSDTFKLPAIKDFSDSLLPSRQPANRSLHQEGGGRDDSLPFGGEDHSTTPGSIDFETPISINELSVSNIALHSQCDGKIQHVASYRYDHGYESHTSTLDATSLSSGTPNPCQDRSSTKTFTPSQQSSIHLIQRITAGKHTGPIPGSTSTVRSSQLNPSWIIHCPKVQKINLAILDLLPPAIATRIQELLDLAKNSASLPPDKSRRFPDVDWDILSIMIKTGVAVEIDAESARNLNLEPNCVIFLVEEPQKSRYRIITWPLQANELPYTWSQLPHQADPLDIIQDVFKYSFASSYDLKCSFYQVPLDKSTHKNFIFRSRGKLYTMDRLPMGFRPAAEILQLLLEGLALLIADTVGLEDNTIPLQFRVHVDNVMFFGTWKQLQAADTAFRSVCHDFGITLGECSAPSTTTKFHAVVLNFATKQVSFAPKGIANLTQVWNATRRNTADPDIVRFMLCQQMDSPSLLKIFGILTFYSRLLFQSTRFIAGNLAQHWGSLQLLRAAGNALFHGGTTIDVTRASRLALAKWAKLLTRHATFSPIQYSTMPRLTLFTDASLTGGGYVLASSTEVQKLTITHQGGWLWKTPTTSRQIALAELAAVHCAISLLFAQEPSQDINLILDSQAVLGALRKGYSPSPALNRKVAIFYSMCRKLRISICSLHYIHTTMNPADPWSRQTNGIHTKNWE
jgi:hypothetical protein